MGSAIKVRIILGMLQRVRTQRRGLSRRPQRAQELGWKRSDAVIGTKLMFGGPGMRAPARRLCCLKRHAVTVCTYASTVGGRLAPSGVNHLSIGQQVFTVLAGPNDVGLSRKHIIEGLKASLKRLDMVGR